MLVETSICSEPRTVFLSGRRACQPADVNHTDGAMVGGRLPGVAPSPSPTRPESVAMGVQDRGS